MKNLYSKNSVLKHTILYVHCVDLRSTKFDFIFYDFLWFTIFFKKDSTKII
jgi:hypothetical protein